jgi:predicted RNase H-like HicB family nuclease
MFSDFLFVRLFQDQVTNQAVRVPLTSRWQLEYGGVPRCLHPSDLWLSDSMPLSNQICSGFVRCASSLPGDGGGISCWPGRSGWTGRLERASPRLRGGHYAAPGEHGPARRSVPRSWCGRIGVVTRVVHVPYVVEQDEDGIWCASAQLRPGVGAVGDGPTAEAAVADLRDALEALLAEVGPPDELTLTLDVA